MKIFKDCTEDQITQAAQALIDGHLVAFPTETVYGLGADASNASAVSRVYEVKGRPKDHPLIVHISSVNQFTHWASEIPDYAFELATRFWPGPMTLILPRSPLAKDFITGNQNNVGIRVPANQIALTLLSEFEKLGGFGVAAPSANRFGAVSPTSADHVVEELGSRLDYHDIILAGKECLVGIESTIVNCTGVNPEILRPGSVTQLMIEEVTRLKLIAPHPINSPKASGSLESHYSPKARVHLNSKPNVGDGFLALSDIPTPVGSVRLATPNTVEEYAQQMYAALRLADHLNLNNVTVILPFDSELSIAIKDRLSKAAAKD